MYPSSVEVCDGVDNNCDGSIDEGLTEDGFFDLDGDGFGGAASTGCFDENLVQAQGDCDDQNEEIHPNAIEICDGIDNNCDGDIDEYLIETWFSDNDGDGFGDSQMSYFGCQPPSGYVLDNQDCDDLDSMIYPGAVEICDYLDNNCDGIIDEGGGLLYLDYDGDGFGDPSSSVSSCMPVSGYVSDNTDCDDIQSSVHPGADEYCNSIDDDCDGSIDEQGVVDGLWFYPDDDGDGFGNSNGVTACSQPIGYVQNPDDCDDQNDYTYPGAAELDSLTLCMCDEDEDGYGTTSPTGIVDSGSDCDDGLALVYVGADEYCNGIDDNCDGITD
ncbi:MAG: hypothetical protein CL916_10535, partial [Deltaproteobacteria bacterium]|nr:hypothetical protein [Deltaproteobacteria bacterium]